MAVASGSNGTANQHRLPPDAGPAFAALEETAAIVIRKAEEIRSAGPSAPLSQEWQGVFAAARTALEPPAVQSAQIAAFGMRTLLARADALAAQSPAARARAQTLAATVVELYAQNQRGTATALSSLVAEISGDGSLPPLLPFFVCLEALVRCRLADDTGATVGAPASGYWRIAVVEARAASLPRLILCAGLSGSGKSFVANGVGCAVGARVISSDTERKRLAGLEPAQPTPAELTSRVYNGRMTDKVYRLLTAEAEAELRAGRPVVLDATFLTPTRRLAAIEIVRELQLPVATVWCSLGDAAAESRLGLRAGKGWTVSDADARIRRLQRHGMQRPRQGEGGSALISIDTGMPPATLFSRLLPRLRRALGAR